MRRIGRERSSLLECAYLQVPLLQRRGRGGEGGDVVLGDALMGTPAQHQNKTPSPLGAPYRDRVRWDHDHDHDYDYDDGMDLAGPGRNGIVADFMQNGVLWACGLKARLV